MTPVASLNRLGTETWGERLARAQRRSGMTYRETAEKVSAFYPTTYGSLMRMEKRNTAPSDLSRRFLAYLTVVAYGFDPSEFGLSDEDLPRGISPEGVRTVLSGGPDLRTKDSIWDADAQFTLQLAS